MGVVAALSSSASQALAFLLYLLSLTTDKGLCPYCPVTLPQLCCLFCYRKKGYWLPWQFPRIDPNLSLLGGAAGPVPQSLSPQISNPLNDALLAPLSPQEKQLSSSPVVLLRRIESLSIQEDHRNDSKTPSKLINMSISQKTRGDVIIVSDLKNK